MLVLMLLIFDSTYVTNRGANLAEICNKTGIPADKRGTMPAQILAIDAKLRAFHHLPKALIPARFALFGTSRTGFHTGLILMSRWKILLCGSIQL